MSKPYRKILNRRSSCFGSITIVRGPGFKSQFSPSFLIFRFPNPMYSTGKIQKVFIHSTEYGFHDWHDFIHICSAGAKVTRYLKAATPTASFQSPRASGGMPIPRDSAGTCTTLRTFIKKPSLATFSLYRRPTLCLKSGPSPGLESDWDVVGVRAEASARARGGGRERYG